MAPKVQPTGPRGSVSNEPSQGKWIAWARCRNRNPGDLFRATMSNPTNCALGKPDLIQAWETHNRWRWVFRKEAGAHLHRCPTCTCGLRRTERIGPLELSGANSSLRRAMGKPGSRLQTAVFGNGSVVTRHLGRTLQVSADTVGVPITFKGLGT